MRLSKDNLHSEKISHTLVEDICNTSTNRICVKIHKELPQINKKNWLYCKLARNINKYFRE